MKSKWDLILCVVVCIVCDVCVVGKCVAAIIRQRNKAAPLQLRDSLSQTFLFFYLLLLFICTEDNLRFSKIPNVPAVYTWADSVPFSPCILFKSLSSPRSGYVIKVDFTILQKLFMLFCSECELTPHTLFLPLLSSSKAKPTQTPKRSSLYDSGSLKSSPTDLRWWRSQSCHLISLCPGSGIPSQRRIQCLTKILTLTFSHWYLVTTKNSCYI